MNVYEKDDVVVRTVEENDIAQIVSLVYNEDFDYMRCSDYLKPNAYATLDILSNIVEKKKISMEALVIEDKGSFRGYAIIDRYSKHKYYITQIAVAPGYRRHGYGEVLIDVIKRLAYQDESSIGLNCYSNQSRKFYHAMQIYEEGDYSYMEWNGRDSNIKTYLPSIFTSYGEIIAERERETEESIKKFKKHLKPEVSRLMNYSHIQRM